MDAINQKQLTQMAQNESSARVDGNHLFVFWENLLNKTLFEPVRKNHRHVIIKLEVGYQIDLFVSVQQPAITADKNVSLLGNNLRAPIPLIIETPDINH